MLCLPHPPSSNYRDILKYTVSNFMKINKIKIQPTSKNARFEDIIAVTENTASWRLVV
jgi:hypothetical protein